jgi:isopentenyl-diphosphate Delta-isomerase
MDDVRTSRGDASADISTDSEPLILVDESDREVGQLSKALCHAGRGVRHRAFSLLIFNDAGELLLQQRAPTKRLWPLYWSGSCCSHPRHNETLDAAIHRRLGEELGIRCDLRFLYKFEYQAQFDPAGAEHEMCSVYIGGHDGPVEVNREEIAGLRWVAPEALGEELAGPRAARLTPWFILEWQRVWRDHRAELEALQLRKGA